MAQSTEVYLFGDQTYDFVPRLRELLSQQDSPLLTAFLEQAHYVVRAQMIQTLSPEEHKAARTADLAQMVQKYVSGDLSPAFQTALSCICQIGSFMRSVIYTSLCVTTAPSDITAANTKAPASLIRSRAIPTSSACVLARSLLLLSAAAALFQNCFLLQSKQFYCPSGSAFA